MDLHSDDDDFEPKAKPGIKSKRRANGDSDEDFAPVKQKKKQKKDEVPRKTSTQGKVDSVTATGRGGRPTARLSVEEAKFQEDLQLALRVSSEEDLDGAGGSEDDLDHQTGGKNKKAPRKASKKETDLVVVNDEGSIVLGDTDDEEIAVAQCPNSSSTTVILGQEDCGDAKHGEVNAKGDCENIVLEDSEDEETEVAKVAEEQLPKKILKEELVTKKNLKPKRTTVGETWVVGERSRRSSGDQRSRKKPQKYVESSDSENDMDGVIDSNESDEEFEEEKKKKQSKAKKAPLKKPNKIQVDKNSATSRTSENPAGESKRNEVSEKKVLEVSPGNQPTPASPVRPFGIHNPSSPCTTPTPSLSLSALLKLKTDAGGSKPSSPNLHRGSPAWKPPAKVGSSLANSSNLPASPGLSPGLRRLGLSRNWKSPAPLHKNLKLSQ